MDEAYKQRSSLIIIGCLTGRTDQGVLTGASYSRKIKKYRNLDLLDSKSYDFKDVEGTNKTALN
ncbi:hypothetical protein [Acetivibrio clariflavus]|uniref:hypothetical protein n=1 Tax=Acetivibrio clariflavus TaxID=288965 RepID=UPI000484F576|nr:hypothetical protein [Acetivibrio clariflavus]